MVQTNYVSRLQEAVRDFGLDPGTPAAAHLIAETLKVSYNAGKKALNGATGANSAANAITLARRLNVSSDWLCAGLGPKKRNPDPGPVLSPEAAAVVAAFERITQQQVHEVVDAVGMLVTIGPRGRLRIYVQDPPPIGPTQQPGSDPQAPGGDVQS